MKTNLSNSKIAVMILGLVSLVACNQQPTDRQGVERQGASVAETAKVCGTNIIVDNPSNKRSSDLKLNVRPELCGRMAGARSNWHALGRGVVTSSVFLADSEDALDSAKKYDLVVKGKEVYAVNGSREIKIGRLNVNQHGNPLILEKSIAAQLGASKDQDAYELSAKMKKPDDERVFLIVPSLRKKS